MLYLRDMSDTSFPRSFSHSLSRFLPARLQPSRPLVPVIRLSGAIGIGTPMRPALTLASCAHALDQAFGISRAKEVAIIVDSPGGSPVQSHLIFQRIRQLAEEKERRVTVFVEDVAASGGYMIACAGDEIVADPSSIIGSIGVVSAGFGFTGLIEKIGVERRVHTSGDNKMMLDPFQPEKAEDIKRLKAIQKDVHEDFIALVRNRRGTVLDEGEKALFSGAFWTGRKARLLGLIDRLGDLRGVMRERYGDKVILLPVGQKRGLSLRRFLPGRTSLAEDALLAAEVRALWARYGL